ncbi:MAG: hypothetical protein CBC16_01720 [Verrucomicrobia bacterium TMED56]|nr:MAG: hypothetical protein CBC16_01720 [Verrucomicrobia bacterium TMED56]
MRLSFIGLEIILNKKNSKKSISFNDINYMNNETLLYIKKLSKKEIDSRTEELIKTCETDVGKIKQILNDKGIVIIKDFVPEVTIDKISQDLKNIREEISSFISTNNTFKDNANFFFQKDNAKFTNYSELANYKKTVANIRGGQDKGMIDIFNVDKCNYSLGNILIPFFNQKIIFDILSEESSNLNPTNLNLYLNNDITKTRGFHVDTYNKKIKIFLYLEDCLNLDDGPYTYVKESHINSRFAKINQCISSNLSNYTETPFVSLENITPVLAKRGTLVISDQSGSHRGFPQALGHKRAVAVMNYIKL